MQGGHFAFVAGEFEHVFAFVGVVLDRDAADVFKIVGHCRFLALSFVLAFDGYYVAVNRDALEPALLLLFANTAVWAKDLKSGPASPVSRRKSR